MDLQINQKSRVPVHVQLEEQIKHLILTGRFEVGSRLPSIRAMAGFLRINRNTVARVISDLEREGFVESRRGSGVYVVEPPVDAEASRRQEVLERVMDLAAAQGVSVEELGNALLARSGVRPQEKVPILFVECTGAELDQFSSELGEQLPVEVERVLLENLPARLSGEEDPPWRTSRACGASPSFRPGPRSGWSAGAGRAWRTSRARWRGRGSSTWTSGPSTSTRAARKRSWAPSKGSRRSRAPQSPRRSCASSASPTSLRSSRRTAPSTRAASRCSAACSASCRGRKVRIRTGR